MFSNFTGWKHTHEQKVAVNSVTLLNDSTLYSPSTFIWEVVVHRNVKPRIYSLKTSLIEPGISRPFEIFPWPSHSSWKLSVLVLWAADDKERITCAKDVLGVFSLKGKWNVDRRRQGVPSHHGASPGKEIEKQALDRKSLRLKCRPGQLRGGPEPNLPMRGSPSLGQHQDPSHAHSLAGCSLVWTWPWIHRGSSWRLPVTHILCSSLFWRQPQVRNHAMVQYPHYTVEEKEAQYMKSIRMRNYLIQLPGQQSTWTLLTLELNSPAKWGTWVSDLMFLSFIAFPKRYCLKVHTCN